MSRLDFVSKGKERYERLNNSTLIYCESSREALLAATEIAYNLLPIRYQQS